MSSQAQRLLDRMDDEGVVQLAATTISESGDEILAKELLQRFSDETEARDDE